MPTIEHSEAFLSGFTKAAYETERLEKEADWQDVMNHFLSVPGIGGAAVGGGLGYLSGRDEKNPENDHSGRNALIGALGGGAAGTGINYGANAFLEKLMRDHPEAAGHASSSLTPHGGGLDGLIRQFTSQTPENIPQTGATESFHQPPPTMDLGSGHGFFPQMGNNAPADSMSAPDLMHQMKNTLGAGAKQLQGRGQNVMEAGKKMVNQW